MGDLRGQVSGRTKLRNVLLCNGGSHTSALRAGFRHDWEAWYNEVEPWMLELEVGRAKEKVGAKPGGLGSIIKETNIKRLLLNPKNCLFLRNHTNGVVGLPMLVLMRIPQ